jgi:2-oxo-4-hydroxy-4-carboxy--5-ureidoimidazoline (OHCU) decarboxylase
MPSTPQASSKPLAALHALAAEPRIELFRSLCGAQTFAERMASAMPFATVRSWFAAADRAFAVLDEAGWLEAFAAHPALGESKAAAGATAESAKWSSRRTVGIAAGRRPGAPGA